jgi:hypothetical protein
VLACDSSRGSVRYNLGALRSGKYTVRVAVDSFGYSRQVGPGRVGSGRARSGLAQYRRPGAHGLMLQGATRVAATTRWRLHARSTRNQ